MAKELRKLNKGGELSWILGLLLIPLGVAICSKADLGISVLSAPSFIIYEAIEDLVPFFTVGVVEYLVQAVLAILLCIIVGKVKLNFILAIFVGVIYGYILDMWMLILGPDLFEAVWLRYVMLIVGDICIATGVAFFFITYLPVQSYDMFVKGIAQRYKISFNVVKPIYDLSLLVISLVLAFSLFGDAKEFNWADIYKTSFHSLGVGTLITAFISSPIIAVASKIVNKFIGEDPLIPKLKQFFDNH